MVELCIGKIPSSATVENKFSDINGELEITFSSLPGHDLTCPDMFVI